MALWLISFQDEVWTELAQDRCQIMDYGSLIIGVLVTLNFSILPEN
jgi:hypothetical protein